LKRGGSVIISVASRRAWAINGAIAHYWHFSPDKHNAGG
jgi:hypothetical protein